MLRRAWTRCARTGGAAAEASGAVSFRVLSWNVLADGLAQFGEFSRAPAEVLTHEYRWPLIQAELRSADADIAALYEMNHPEALALGCRDHAMLWVPKISSAALRFGAPPDGIAVLVRRSRFDVVDTRVVYYRGAADGPVHNQNAVIALLRDRTNHQYLLLGATHLKAKGSPEDVAVRTLQMEQLLRHVDAFAHAQASITGIDAGALPIVLCGDWNGSPTEPLYALALGHSRNFRSVYNALGVPAAADTDAARCAAHEPAFTTWKWRTAAHGGSTEKCTTIDYIMVSTRTSSASCGRLPVQGLEALELLALPTKEEIGAHALPSAAYASDHLALGVTLCWTPAPGVC